MFWIILSTAKECTLVNCGAFFKTWVPTTGDSNWADLEGCRITTHISSQAILTYKPGWESQEQRPQAPVTDRLGLKSWTQWLRSLVATLLILSGSQWSVKWGHHDPPSWCDNTYKCCSEEQDCLKNSHHQNYNSVLISYRLHRYIYWFFPLSVTKTLMR